MSENTNRGIYTCANDNFASSLEGLLRSIQISNPNLPVYVIPFDDECKKIKEICDEYGVVFWDGQVEFWDSIGSKIYGDRNHRPTIKKKNYFRKLSGFMGPLEEFIFVDVSIRVLSDVTKVFEILADSDYDILFHARSLPFRNFHNDALIEVLEAVNPNIRRGFAAGCLVSKSGIFDRKTVEALASPGEMLAPLFGGAPEQSFMNYYCGITGIKCERLIHADSSFPMSLTPEKIEKIGEGEYFRKTGKVDAKKKLYFALARERNTPAGHEDYWLIEEFNSKVTKA
ncbi:MAG: hypothetical protein JKY31_02760 [Rhodobacteraceae bacterium]|nr:hypothetical protein [Paracoccaceae bacterium]